MKIVVAPDSFKGSLSAREVGLAIRKGVERALPHADIPVVPMADGGEGTLECLIDATGGTWRTAEVRNPLGELIEASYGLLGDGVTCAIEMAQSSGLYLIAPEQRDPLRTTTYGVGELIQAGLDQGCRRFLLGLGGSATNDGGAGMLQALGVELLDAQGGEIGQGGGELSKLREIRTAGLDPRLADCEFLIACDVDNPFVGPKGASHVFGPQKGATPKMVLELDANLRHFANLIDQTVGVAIHDLPGTGAAGGLSGALLAFLGGKLQSGIQLVIEAVGLEEQLRDADLVITGEGQIDFQTAHGKTPSGVALLAQSHGIPTIALCGSVGDGIDVLHEQGIAAVYSIVNQPMTLEEAMARTAELLTHTAEQVIRTCIMTKQKG
ncbi:MAG TPA: glycerate kinase [Bacilli bacterium]|nr:glycerate kinase [Bacilli bacterium]